MSDLKIYIEDYSQPNPDKTVKIAHFRGQLDLSNVEDRWKIIDDVIKNTPKNLYFIFDFRDLSYLNSTGLAYLARCSGLIESANGKMVIINMNKNILDIFNVIGFNQLIKSYPTLEEAVKDLLN